jgi:hypothetical protein
MIEVEARKAGISPVFIAKPFFVEDSGVTFKLNVVPGFIPGVPHGSSGNTTIYIESTGQAVNIQLYVDGLPPGVTATFDNTTLTVPPGGSGTTRLTITTRASTPPGQYPLTIRGINGPETRMMPFGFGVMSIGAGEGHGTITINPPRARPGEHIGISGAGFTRGNTITLTAAPPGAATINITPGTIQVQSDGTWATEITVPTAGQGTYIIKASDGVMAAKNVFSIVPAKNADFFLNLSPQFLKVNQGYTGNTTLTLSSKNGFKEAMRFSVGHLAPGVTATFRGTSSTG